MIKEEENRLSKRAWIINNFERLLEESVYYKHHKENFKYPSYKLWSWDKDESKVLIPYVD